MDSTETHYLTYDPEAIWTEMTTAYIEEGGEPLYPGDEKEMLLRAVQALIVQGFAGVDNALRMQTLRYAVGEYLDILGETRGCTRIAAQAATGTVELSGEETIPAGTLLTVDGSVFYATDDEISSTEDRTVSITCTTSGASGNGLVAGTVLYPTSGSGLIFTATLLTGGTDDGQDEESDDDYRTRIQTYLQSSLTTGSKENLEEFALESDSRVSEAYAAVSEVSGTEVTAVIYFLCEDTTVEDAVKDVIDADIEEQHDSVFPIGYVVTSQPATTHSYTMNITATGNESTRDTLIAETVEEYQEWQDNHFSKTFIPEKLVGMLYAVGFSSVTIDADSTFDGGTAQRTEIPAWERCIGTINVHA